MSYSIALGREARDSTLGVKPRTLGGVLSSTRTTGNTVDILLSTVYLLTADRSCWKSC